MKIYKPKDVRKYIYRKYKIGDKAEYAHLKDELWFTITTKNILILLKDFNNNEDIDNIMYIYSLDISGETIHSNDINKTSCKMYCRVIYTYNKGWSKIIKDTKD